MSAAEDRARSAPVFIVGAPRSGTTLLAAMLDRHPDVAVSPETDFFLLGPPRGATHSDLVDAFFEMPRARDLGVTPEAVATRLAGLPCTPGVLLTSVLLEYADRRGARFVGEKTPEHLLCADEILTAIPEAKIVCVERDGRDVALSLLRAGFTHPLLRIHCHRWLEATRAARRLRRSEPDRFRCIRFEDLLESPEPQLRSLCSWLGFELSPEQLDASGEAADLVPQRERVWKQKALEPPDRSRVQAWRSEATPRQLAIMEGIMAAELERLGYPLQAEARDRRPLDALASRVSALGYHLAYRVLRRHLPHDLRKALTRMAGRPRRS
jgi:hypothetical protein